MFAVPLVRPSKYVVLLELACYRIVIATQPFTSKNGAVSRIEAAGLSSFRRCDSACSWTYL